MRHIILTLALTLSTGTQIAAQDTGYAELTITAPHHDQDMQMAVMFPATGEQRIMVAENAVFYGTTVLSDAEPVPGKYPVVLLSHGWGGAIMRGWHGSARVWLQKAQSSSLLITQTAQPSI